MILYKHQLVELESRNEPAIYLGIGTDNRHWFACYDYTKKEFKPDWYSTNMVGYYKVNTKLPTPSKQKIYFGSLKENIISPPYRKEDYPAEELDRLKTFIDAFKLKLELSKQTA